MAYSIDKPLKFIHITKTADDMDDELIEYINGIYDKDFKEFNYEKISRPRING